MLPHKPKSLLQPTLSHHLHHNEAESSIHANQLEDDRHSFTTAQIKLQNWQYINDYDDSEMVIQLSSDGEHFSLSSEEGVNCENKTYNQVKIEENSVAYLESKSYCKSGQPNKQWKKRVGKIENRRDRDSNINSLKNISLSVCDFVDSFHYVKLPDMMNKFIDENPQYAKNLRRRMYDVINVLSSANIIQKKGLLLKRRDNQKISFNESLKQEKDYRLKIQNLNKQISEKCQRIEEKRKRLAQLKKQKKNVAKSSQKNQTSTNQKIMFPLAYFFPNPQTIAQIENHSIQTHIGQMSKKLNICYSHEDLINLLNVHKIETQKKENQNLSSRLSKEIPIIFISQNMA